MNDKVLDGLIELYDKTKKECVEKEMFYDNLKRKLEKDINGKNKVLKQYKMSCTSFLESKLLEFDTSIIAVIISIASLIFSIFALSKEKLEINMVGTTILMLVLIFVITFLTIKQHIKERKVREILYIINDI